VLKPRHAPSSNRRPAPRGDGAAPAASPVAEDHRAPSGPGGAPSAANRRSARPGAQHHLAPRLHPEGASSLPCQGMTFSCCS
jgi:hypothetical protein